MADLLLYSLGEFRELIFALMGDAAPRHIVEIGAESGRFTAELAKWADEHGARLTTVDPAPAPVVRALAQSRPKLIQLVLELSLPALGRIDAAEFYLIDGDHNFYTVANELRLIDAAVTRAEAHPVIVVHDVGWPCARRDQYYDPKSLPPEHVHPHRYDRGIHVDSPEMVEGGFRGAGAFAHAEREGGPENGVLTAVEAFLASHPGWEFYKVPAIFGLGILFPSVHPKRDMLVERVRFYHDNPLLARIEDNRLRSFLHILALQDRNDATLRELESLRAAWCVRLARWLESKPRALFHRLFDKT